MRNTLMITLILLASSALGCGRGQDADPVPRTTTDMTPEMAPDMTPEMTPEMAPDMTPDMIPDMTPDPPMPPDPGPSTDTTIDWNGTARVIAGLSDGLGDVWAGIAALPAYRKHVENSDKMWKPVEQKRAVVEKWVKTELANLNADCRTLFYPFSGPDFLHVHLLFPGCRDVVMIGLEPAGTPPDKDRILEKPQKFFSKLEASLIHILTLSYFRTQSMKADLFGKEVPELDGTLAPILFMMARTGHRVDKVERVQLDWDGKVVPWTGTLPDPPDPPATTGRKRKVVKKTWRPFSGLRYTYQAVGDPAPRTLTYFSCNLANEVFREVDGILVRHDLQKYLRSLEISTTYTKAASYLMHQNNFLWIRNLILERSPSYLQDDSGMPLAAFDEAKWDLTFYGHYDAPIELFAEKMQEDLASRYASRKRVKPLPFGIGYKVYPGLSNLQLAIRKK
jgi:hypothetical protein